MGRGLSFVLALLTVTGCARTSLPPLEPGEIRIVRGDTGEIVPIEQVMDDLASVDVVYVGEQHDDPDHHQVELTILRAMAQRHEELGLGMEMFQHPFQRDLDEYLSDEIGEVAMLRRTEWYTRWGFPWDLYAPMVRFARDEQIPVVALNAPTELTKAVARKGLAGLTEEERSQLPELDLNDPEHRAFIGRLLSAHHGMDPERLDAFYEAQVVWDETMAERTFEYVRGEAEDRPMVVLAGIGHVAYGHGIPSRVERRMGGAGTGRTVIPTTRMRSVSHIAEGTADWLWIIRDQ